MRKLTTVLAAGLIGLAVVAASPQPAEARRGGGFVFGAIAGGILGAVIVNEIYRRKYRSHYYYPSHYYYRPAPAFYRYNGYNGYYRRPYRYWY